MTTLYIGGAEDYSDCTLLYDAGFTHLWINANRTLRHYKKLRFDKRLAHFLRFKDMFKEVLVEFLEYDEKINDIDKFADIVAYPYRCENSFTNIPLDKRCPVTNVWDDNLRGFNYIGIEQGVPPDRRLFIVRKAKQYDIKIYGGSVAAKPDDIWAYRYDTVRTNGWLRTRIFGLRIVFQQDRLRIFNRDQNDYGLTRAACIKYNVDYDLVTRTKGKLPRETLLALQQMALGAYKEWMMYLSNR